MGMRIRCSGSTEPNAKERKLLRDLIRSTGDAWTDGCYCQLCQWYDRHVDGYMSRAVLVSLLATVVEVTGGEHGDGYFPAGCQRGLLERGYLAESRRRLVERARRSRNATAPESSASPLPRSRRTS